jgi:hypothetical protein
MIAGGFMAFSLELTFTGIAAFIQTDEEAPIYVIMPGLEGAKDALDGEALCPHNSYIEPNFEPCSVGGRTDPGVYFHRTSLKGQFVRIELTYAADAPLSTTYLPDSLIDMKVLLGDTLCSVNKDVLTRTSPPRPAFVMTQVLLPANGTFDACEDDGWSVDQVDGGYGTPIAGPLAHAVRLTFENLTKAVALLEPMDGTPSSYVELTPKSGAWSYVSLINTCKDLDPQEPKSLRDRDFKWYFELLDDDSRLTILALIGNDDLPVPRYIPPNGVIQVKSLYPVVLENGGHDCFPAQMAAYSENDGDQLLRRKAIRDLRDEERRRKAERAYGKAKVGGKDAISKRQQEKPAEPG